MTITKINDTEINHSPEYILAAVKFADAHRAAIKDHTEENSDLQ